MSSLATPRVSCEVEDEVARVRPASPEGPNAR